MITKHNTSILCPTNDLEAHTIIALASKFGFSVFKGPNFWGATLLDAIEHIDFEKCKPNLIAIELPDINEEGKQFLARKGIKLHLLDHHQYSDCDKRNTHSAIEQFAKIFSLRLSAYDKLVAANDRGFIPGLLTAGATYYDMKKIRDDEANVRGVGGIRREAFSWFESQNIEQSPDKIFYLDCPARFTSVMSEVAQFPSKVTYERALSLRQPLKLRQVVLRYIEQDHVTQIEVLARKNRDKLSKLVKKWPFVNLKSWFGGEAPNYFFGAVAKSKFVKSEPQFDVLYNELKGILK
ncbi:hypothetical protein J8L98_15030 [Pseudoalteromonas sp. MMG013]|uniref:hypothetical protein n=1 Tax=Pseudoalteromonas sp. MMG013 TaxID=2822687 RepID=UPI001B37750D|nr:hypothetical protein [Pseudoalteromonas sp. MMG013]MBQ4862999.1 hypothetical protein [Pseudoalteromonas sp. MMG013]